MTATLETWRDPTNRHRANDLLNALLRLLEMRLPYMRGRSRRIDDGCCVFAEALSLRPDERFALSLAARFHDLGFLGIPDTILLKPGALSPEERTAVDCHTDVGGRLVHYLFPDFPDAVEAIWWHHERPDGKGPHGLMGDTIPLLASILAVVDAVESMANERRHRAARPLGEIRIEIEQNAGTQFDSQLATLFPGVAQALYHAVAPDKAMGEVVSAPKPKSIVPPPAPPVQSQAPPDRGRASVAEPPQAPNKRFVARRTSSAHALEGLAPLIKKQDLVALISKGLEMKPLAATVQTVMSATANARCDIEDVARAVSRDQTLSLRVLKIANSSAYSRGRHTDTVASAVARIGVQQVRKLVMGLGVMHEYSSVPGDRLDPRLFWEHSVACGLIATAIARLRNDKDTDDYFLWGMIHDVGRIILLTQLPETYLKVWDAASTLDVPLETVEAKLMLLDHCAVLARALEHWQFPREFLAPVVNHHQSVLKLKRLGPRVAEEAMTIALSNGLAHALLLGSSGNDVLYPLDDLIEALQLPPDAIQQFLHEIPDQTAQLRLTLMSHSDDTDWPNVARCVRERLPANFHPLTVSLEPRTDAMNLVCEVLGASSDDDSPTLGVLYLRDARELPTVLSRYDAQEKKAGVGPLPILLVWDKGRIEPDNAWLKARRHVTLQMPVRIDTLVDAVSFILG